MENWIDVKLLILSEGVDVFDMILSIYQDPLEPIYNLDNRNFKIKEWDRREVKL